MTARAAPQKTAPKIRLASVPPAATRRVSELHAKCTVESTSGRPPVATHMPPWPSPSWIKSAITVAATLIATIVNRSGSVASPKRGGLDSAITSFAEFADMRRIVAAHSRTLAEQYREGGHRQDFPDAWLTQRSFHLAENYCLRTPTVQPRLPAVGRFGAWFGSQIRRLPRKLGRPDSPAHELQYVARKIDGGKIFLRVALTVGESCCPVPLR